MASYLETPRMIFDRPTEKDLPALTGFLTDVEITKFLGGVLKEEKVPEILKWFDQHWNTQGFGPCMVKLRETQETIGLFGLKRVPIEDEQVIDLGFLVDRPYQGQGFAYEGGRALVEHGFNVHQFERIYSNVHPENEVSRHLLQKLGFTYQRNISRENVGIKFSDTQLWMRARSK